MRVKLENICKSFGKVEVLHNLNLVVENNEIVVLMGASGSGKTTTLRCLCDLETPDSGKIMIDDCLLFDNGKVPSKQEKKLICQKIGLVFQDYHLFSHRTILENICEAAIYQKKYDKPTAKIKALELLEKFDLKDKANAYPYELSGGQKQRVSIARACILEPEILCFDEPTSALDPKSIEQLTKIILELKKKMAIIIITHDVAFGKAIGDRQIYMQDINDIV